AAATPTMDVVTLTHQRANGDVGIHVAVTRNPANSTAVNRARARFKFTDDFHGANLRRARNRTTGETRLKQAIYVRRLFESAADAADKVMHVGEALRLEQSVDRNRTKATHTTEIVA